MSHETHNFVLGQRVECSDAALKGFIFRKKTFGIVVGEGVEPWLVLVRVKTPVSQKEKVGSYHKKFWQPTSEMNTETLPPFQAHSATSEAAARSIQPHLGRLESLVLLILRGFGDQGGTDEQVWHEMPSEVKEATCRARRVRLVQLGLVEDSGQTRLSSAKRPMSVWRAVQKQGEAL